MPANAATTTITPAMIPTTTTAPAPKRATTGTSTTVIAPVGPDTCTLEPPNTAATSPATIAVTNPACAPRPVAMPNPSASGSATTPTVTPSDEVAAPRCAHARVVGAAREHRAHASGHTANRGGRAPPSATTAPARRSRRVERFAHEAPAALRPARSSVDSLNDTIMKRFATARRSASSERGTRRRRSSPPCAWSPDPRGAARPAAARGATTRCRPWLHLPDRVLAVGEHLEDADAGRVREGAEELGLRLGDGPAQRGFLSTVRHAKTLVPEDLIVSLRSRTAPLGACLTR